MALGKVNFAAAPSFEPLRNGDYEGVTERWEAKRTKNGDSNNIEARFKVEYEDEKTGENRVRTVMCRWNDKDTALWRIKRDLIAMGADPSEFESDAVDLEGILNRLFGVVPTPVIITLTQSTFTPEGGEPQTRNEVYKVVAR